MKLRTVLIPRDVQEQIREQVLYMAQDSIDSALLWEDRLMAAIQGLGSMAGYSLDQPASERVGYPVHKLVFEGTYLIFYHLDEAAGEVHVVNFRHGARLPRGQEP